MAARAMPYAVATRLDQKTAADPWIAIVSRHYKLVAADEAARRLRRKNPDREYRVWSLMQDGGLCMPVA